jgi:C4-dicarboxylate-specific signal transduction histidine kinase
VGGVGDHVLLTVDDNGPGFAKIRRGIGLGLRAAAGFLKTYGGPIEYSRSWMGGTLATLVLRGLGP